MDWMIGYILFLLGFLFWYLFTSREQHLEGLSDERECSWDPVYSRMRCHTPR
jgi:hypothetical protein